MITSIARDGKDAKRARLLPEPEPEVVGEKPKLGAADELGPNGGPSAVSAFGDGAAIYMTGGCASVLIMTL